MVEDGVPQVCASSELQFGALREMGHCHVEPGNPYRRVRARFGDRGGQLDHRRARGVLNPCVRESKARTERFLREKLISDHGLFSSYGGQHEAANGQE